jgi:hypothetical protein
MAYELAEKLLSATDGGLQIILRYYPQAADAVQRANTKFSIREEKTPSAALKQLKDGNWVVTDFGGDQTSRNGIQVAMYEDGLTYREAVNKFCGEFNVGGISKEINKPDFDKRPANPDEEEGTYQFDVKAELTPTELQLLGPAVAEKPEVCKTRNFYSLNSFTYIKNREAYTTIANDNYPIFLIDNGVWKKIYQPLSYDKQYRFRYVGEKPKNHINGLDLLEKANTKFQEQQMNEAEMDDSDDGKKSKKILRYPMAILCSGDRDALNLAAWGFMPVWLNSETAKLEEHDYARIRKCVEKVYLLPDIDKTGLRAARELGLKFLDLHIIRLPEWLKNYKDNRGKERNDFRDYIELYPNIRDFNKLVNVAMPLQFWDEEWTKNGKKYKYNPEHGANFLQFNGFHTIENKNVKDGAELVQIKGNVVTAVKPKSIRGFMRQFCVDRFLEIDLRNTIRTTTQLSDSSIMQLEELKIDFSDFDKYCQYIFFKNKTLRIGGKEVKEYKAGEIEKYVWNEEVIDHNFKLADEPFTITRSESGVFDITVNNTSSKYMSFLINASRVFWREELEESLAGMSPAEQTEYRKQNKFNIAGKNLTQDQIEIQKQHLINKIFCIGYLLHRYKDKSKPWAIWAMDNKISAEGESHGGSGKSACFGTLAKFMKTVTLAGRNPKLTDNPHIYDRVTEHTDMILIDDADQNLNFKFFFDSITTAMVVNPKNNQSYEIPHELSPKIVFTSNFVLRNIDPSQERRLLYCVFSDYYHEKGEGDEYNETRKISDDFDGKNLFESDYTEEEWNADYNFFAHAVRFYLSVPGTLKLNPPMENVTMRQLLTDMGDAFKMWADAYFAPEESNGNIDNFVVKSVALDDFQKTSKTSWTTNKFTKACKSFCKYYGYVFNPLCFQNGQHRISRKIDGETKDMIFIQTKAIDPTLYTDDQEDNVYVANPKPTGKPF